MSSKQQNTFGKHHLPPEIVNHVFIDYVGEYLLFNGLTAEYANLRLVNKFFNTAIRPIHRSLAMSMAAACIRHMNSTLDKSTAIDIHLECLAGVQKHPQILLNPMSPLPYILAYMIHSITYENGWYIPEEIKTAARRKLPLVKFSTQPLKRNICKIFDIWYQGWHAVDLSQFKDSGHPTSVERVVVLKGQQTSTSPRLLKPSSKPQQWPLPQPTFEDLPSELINRIFITYIGKSYLLNNGLCAEHDDLRLVNKLFNARLYARFII
ncbi:hypothetical protein HDV00_011668 [Rhizophlyctis rosea]|nr:hypothetical protein HDV00_011668 [Rhizophlyctis rosea]